MFNVIPEVAMKDKNLKPNSKLLLGIIISLSKGPFGCIATNHHFMEILNIESDKTIRRYLNELKTNKYIESEMIQREGTRNEVRIITPIWDYLPKSKDNSNRFKKKDKLKREEPEWLDEVIRNL